MDYELWTPDGGALPLWFLDVDGVVNCFPSPSFKQLMDSQGWCDTEVQGYKIWHRSSVVAFINRVAQEGLCQPVWLTTWEKSAAQALAPALGLAPFPVVGAAGGGGDFPDLEWWKWLRLREALGSSERPFIWTDDDLSPTVREEAEKLPSPKLLIIPESNPGLADGELALVEKFLKSFQK